MRIGRLQTALLSILLAAAAAHGTSAQTPSAQPAQDVATLMVNVVYTHAGGVVRLNGIPIERFGGGSPESGDSGTLFIGNGMTNFGINGVNTLTVEAKAVGPEADSSTELILADAAAEAGDASGVMAHPLFRKKIAGAGTIQYSLTLRNVPHRLFDDASPWSGDPKAVLTAVQALHKAFVSHDRKAIAAFLRPAFESSGDARQMGSFDDVVGNFEKSLEASKVAALPVKLNVESFYGGRLFRVTDANGLAPIRAASIKTGAGGQPGQMLEMGEFWCYRNGAWVLLGD